MSEALDRALNRALAAAARKFAAREIVVRYLPRPALTRFIATALIEHHRVPERLKASGLDRGQVLGFDPIAHWADQPVARGEGKTAVVAVDGMIEVAWTRIGRHGAPGAAT